MAKKSWTEKLNDGKSPEVKPVPKDMMGMKQGQIMLIATPKIVEEFIRKIPVGKSVDVPTMRTRLAKKYKAEVTCPLTTGIFLRIVAEAANERHEAGEPISRLTPVWRVIGPKAPVMKKLTFDASYMMAEREAEGLVP